MRIVSYWRDEGWRAGLLVGDGVVDLAAAGGPSGVRAFLGLPAAGREEVAAAAAELSPVGSLDGLRLGPPVPDPEKILCIGLNYAAHAEEVALAATAAPTVFAKFGNSLVGTGAAIEIPASSSEVDYEGEIAVVIGSQTRGVSAEVALDHVAGVMPFNDVSARDLQMETSQWTMGKALDTFAPCGPALVTLDEAGDPGELLLRTRLNGETVQEASAGLMLTPIAAIVAFLSRTITLEPGDIIATGTPAGVGFTREPPLFLTDGDVIEVEIAGVGVLSNPVLASDGKR
jgi:2-keto-4-pentenoate hydratase/2-oxohepta-3-ene-1,7-dioic acid hydratase in catechol pathway